MYGCNTNMACKQERQASSASLHVESNAGNPCPDEQLNSLVASLMWGAGAGHALTRALARPLKHNMMWTNWI